MMLHAFANLTIPHISRIDSISCNFRKEMTAEYLNRSMFLHVRMYTKHSNINGNTLYTASLQVYSAYSNAGKMKEICVDDLQYRQHT